MNNVEEKLGVIILIGCIVLVTMFVFFLEVMSKLEKRISKLEEYKISIDEEFSFSEDFKMSSWVTLENCYIRKITERALLVEWEEEDYWFPKACVEDPDRFEEGDDNVTVLITEAIAKDKGIN